MNILKDSPVDEERKTLSRGSGDWPGFDYVYMKIKEACENLGCGNYTRCGDDHVHFMAVMGCGHEETMKYEMTIARSRGLCI